MADLRSMFAATAVLLWGAASVGAADQWTYDPADDHIGRVYYYERSNQDGTLKERVTVFRRSASELEVYKENGLCLNAALVTAKLDLDTLSARTITGGRLEPNAKHQEFAFMEHSAGSDQLTMHVRLPNMEIRDETMLNHPQWQLFDFDLASFTVAAAHIDRRHEGFDFGMALLWAAPSAADVLWWMGELNATFAGTEKHLDRETEMYSVTGSAFEGDTAVGSTGKLWLDATEGFVVDAEFPVPNHPGYTDFRLRLLKVSDGGTAEWTALLGAHFKDCDN